MKATRDFTYASISVKEGQEILPFMFEGDALESLIRKGWVVDKPKSVKKVTSPAKQPVSQPANKSKAGKEK